MKNKYIQLRASAEDIRAIDDIRRKEPDLPNRSEMLRRLIERAAVDRYREAVGQKNDS